LLTDKIFQYFLKISRQTKSTHSFISSFQICPGRQNFEGSPPRLGHSRPSFPKTEEDRTTINKDVKI
ncbi:MAG: hypothetical protein VW497_10475, partial [Paracoccaceae bacterium]